MEFFVNSFDPNIMEYVDVVITEVNLDDRTKSKFKNLGEINREWLPKFLKELEETESKED